MDDKIICQSVKANNNVVHDEKWSTLEKKYKFKDQDQQNNERPKGKQINFLQVAISRDF